MLHEISKANTMLNKTVYVTKSKINNLLREIDLKRSHINTNNLYLSDLSQILSIPEMELLALYRDIVENPESLTLNKYVKKNHVDSKRWVFESIYPSYHKNDRCERLQASFENFEIPVEIKVKGDLEIDEYRRFFKKNINLYNRNYEAFMAQVQLKFNIKNPPKKVDFENTGSEAIFNASCSEIEQKITTLLSQMENFRNLNEENQKEIRDSGFATHKAFEMDEKGVKIKKVNIDGSIISQWHNYKNELKNLLKEYFRIKLNPEFLFDVNILEQLGFKPCNSCYDKESSTEIFIF